MDYEQIGYQRRGPVAVITIERPERMNAIGARAHRELVDAWGRFKADDEALVGILTGAGERAFCAGGDLKSLADGEPVGPTSAAEAEAHERGNGVAYAGGLEWVCWCHLAVADEHASFGVTCRRWNIGLADGGTQRLPRIVGWRRAMELAETIAALPQPAIRTDLEAAARGWGRPLEEGLRIEAECFNRLLGEPEILEGLRRFNERDHPDRDPSAAALTPGLRRGD